MNNISTEKNMGTTNKHNNTTTNKMSDSSVIKPTEFDAENIQFTPLKKNPKNQRLSALILQKNGRPLNLELPKARIPFGVSKFEKGDTGKYVYSVPFSGQGPDQNDEEVLTHFNELKKLDEKIKKYGFENHKMIFKKDLSEAVVGELYIPMVKTTLDDSGVPYPPKIQPKFLFEKDTENPSVLFFKGSSEEPEELGEDGWEVLMESVKKGSFGRAIVQPRLWFIGGKFGCTLNVIQLQVSENAPSRPTKYAFSKRPEDESDKNKSASASASEEGDADEEDNAKETKETKETKEEVDSEAEEEEEEEEEVEEADSDTAEETTAK